VTFERAIDGMDDAEWLALLEHASASDSESFTENRLFALYAERHATTTRRIGRRAWLGFLLMAVGFATWTRSLRGYSGPLMALGVVLALCGVAFAVGGILTERHLPAREPLSGWLRKWRAAHPDVRWLDEPQLEGARAALLEPAPESPRALLIVERDLLVDWLLVNDVARELQLLIVSERGYPAANLRAARNTLAEQRELTVVLLHDATISGTEMQRRVRASSLLPLAGRALLDAGLFPADLEHVAAACQLLREALRDAPLDMLPREALVNGLRGVLRGELQLVAAIDQHQS
jgi:hypothetical protein